MGAHARRCKELHPDTNLDKPDSPINKEKFILVSKAYTILRDPERRKKYDKSLSVDLNFDSRHKTNFSSHSYKHTHGGFPEVSPSNETQMNRRMYVVIFVLSLLLICSKGVLLFDDMRNIYNRSQTDHKLQEIEMSTKNGDDNKD